MEILDIFAHIVFENDVTKKQSLVDHLLNVGELSSTMAESVNLPVFLKFLSYCHDAGKSDQVWQKYINGKSTKKVNHSSAGARFFKNITDEMANDNNWNDSSWFKYYQEVGLYVLLAHHGLYNVINDQSKYHNQIRLDYDKLNDEYNYWDDIVGFMHEFNSLLDNHKQKNMKILSYESAVEFREIYQKISELTNKTLPKDKKINTLYTQKKSLEEKRSITEIRSFYMSCLTRLILSILKEADIYDSSNYYRVEEQQLWNRQKTNSLWKTMTFDIEKQYELYNANVHASDLQKVRTKLANQAKHFAIEHESGIYKLDLPTGSGKTNCSMRYTLNNASVYKKSRIIYVTAFLSILKQSVQSIKQLVGDDYILEHHSNIIPEFDPLSQESDEDQTDYELNQYLIESWEYPIITTTIVQLSNTLFQGKASNLRRFSKLINSNIIIDEVQSIPLKAIYSFNLMSNFLAEIMNCTIIHCTATPPSFDLDQLKFPIIYGGHNNENFICDRLLANSPSFDRVDFFNLTGPNAETSLSTSELLNKIQYEIENLNSCLVVVNTKSAALTLYKEACEKFSDTKIIYLSTNLCPAHRLQIIKNLKNNLINNREDIKPKTKIICISTQLIEAGVDLDFDLVFRSISGIDSLIQAAGRCNREGKLNINNNLYKGKIFAFLYDKEKLEHLESIQIQRKASKEALRAVIKDHDQKLNILDVYRYYGVAYFIQNENEMSFNLKQNQNVVDLLSINSNKREEFRIANQGEKYQYKLAQSFKSAAEGYQFIDEDTVGVIVHYQNKDLLDKLDRAIEKSDYEEIRKTLKLLQPYSINMYRTNIKDAYLRKELEGNILILEESSYDIVLGASFESLPNLIV